MCEHKLTPPRGRTWRRRSWGQRSPGRIPEYPKAPLSRRRTFELFSRPPSPTSFSSTAWHVASRQTCRAVETNATDGQKTRSSVIPNVTDGRKQHDGRLKQHGRRSNQIWRTVKPICTVADLIEVHTLKVAEEAWWGTCNEHSFPHKETLRRWAYGTCATIW